MENLTKKQPLQIVLEYFKAWNNKEFDRASDYLSAEISFEMPLNSYTSKEAFMEAVKFTGNAVLYVQLLAEFGNENDALLLYDMELNPVGKLRIAEYFKVSNNKITLICHVHDTTELRKAGFDKNI